VLTSAADYGTARTRKVSRFVVEALDLPSPSPAPRRSSALEAIMRAGANAASAGPAPAVGEPPGQPIRLSFAQMDDYLTCPLKYRYVHVLRVPLLTHHRVVYGHAIHEAVQRHFKARMLGRHFSEDDLVAAFHSAWISEGFLSHEHEVERLRTGEATLRRFHRQEAEHPLHPTAVEKEFAFFVGQAKVVGRYDLVVEQAGAVTILDFKTGAVREQKRADERARKSLQLDIYALAHLRTSGQLPQRVELHFLEAGLVGGKTPTVEASEQTVARIRDVAEALRRREFPARPQWQACSQCAFRDICPFTAWRGHEE